MGKYGTYIAWDTVDLQYIDTVDRVIDRDR